MAVGMIDRLLAAMTVEIDAFALCDIAPDAALVICPLDLVEVYFLLEGTLHLATQGAAPIRVDPGGIVIVPAGLAQCMASSQLSTRLVDPASIEAPLASGVTRYPTGGVGGGRVICGKINADLGGSFGLFDGLAHPLHAQLGDDPLVAAIFATMRRECETGLLGGHSPASALMKACLILVLRQLFAGAGLNRLPALFARPSLLRAILSVVECPQAAHSVASLAATAGMSRSSFARSFAASLDLTPMEFVGQARIARARQLLTSTELSVATVATSAGFASRSHFSRSFRSAVGADLLSFRDRLKKDQHVRRA